MAAEAIARVIHQLSTGNVRITDRVGIVGTEPASIIATIRGSTVVDVTPIFRRLLDTGDNVALYDQVLLPPFDLACYCYENTFGNVYVLHSVVETLAEYEADGLDRHFQPEGEGAEDGHRIDWDQVAYVNVVMCFMGGRSKGQPIRPVGPLYGIRIVVDAEGRPLDITWLGADPNDDDALANTQLTYLLAVNFLNCRNVDIVDPVRPRPERRRIERTGVTVHEINVFPVGKSTRQVGPRVDGLGVPLTSVRGHFATYGQDGRGLLFGKYAGRFWRPQHARGTAELGESDNSYRLEG